MGKLHELGRCYISGPISGRDISVVRARFARVADSLERRGYLPVNPFENGMPEHAIAKRCNLQIIYEDGEYA